MNAFPWPVLLAPLAFAPAFAAIWLLVTFVLSRASGWSGLAARFRAAQPAGGDVFRFASGLVGRAGLPVAYRNCMIVSIEPGGLGLGLWMPFRCGSPPLFIPWSAVESVTDQKVLFSQRVVIRVRDQWQVISLLGPAGERAREAYASRSAARLP